MLTRFNFSALFILLFSFAANANVSVSKIFSNNMVIQRDREIKIWGWASPGESVTVSFNGKSGKAKTSKNGKWLVKIPAMTAGGPYVMKVSGKNSVELNNILIGDVWVCSGQSNMEWIIRNTNDAVKEIAESNYPKLRLFTVTKAMSYTPKEDLEGGTWLECNPKNVEEFSAVAYFFGRKLLKELDVPIGLINTSWGGTNIETWTSWDVMGQIEPYKSADISKQEINIADQQKKKDLYLAAMKSDKGVTEKWFDPNTKVSGWKNIAVPADWGQTEIGNADGIVWYKKEVELPAGFSGTATLSLGPIDDMDVTYVNGQQVGSISDYSKERVYEIGNGILHAGKNIIVVKVRDDQGGGGIYGEKEKLFLSTGEKKYALAGAWEYKASVLTSEYGVLNVGPNSFPSLLYNAMAAPITNFGIKGAIWYQGESNANMAYRYRTYFPNLIKDWRAKWGYEFPFLWVQLANFMAPVAEPSESAWAELREAQSMTLSLPKTGEAVIIDIGEEKDIHPRNKQDVGLRLALNALKVAYGKEIVYTGSTYESMKVEGNKIILTLANRGSGLVAKDKYGYVKGFAIAGSDHKFVWSHAIIVGDQVIVSSEQVSNPVAVRYAWGDNPDDANLYNQEGLPASPFRTDTWKGITEGK